MLISELRGKSSKQSSSSVLLLIKLENRSKNTPISIKQLHLKFTNTRPLFNGTMQLNDPNIQNTSHKPKFKPGNYQATGCKRIRKLLLLFSHRLLHV